MNLHIAPDSHVAALGPLRLVIGIATTGRREVLEKVLPHIAGQTRPPDEIVVCAAVAEDIDALVPQRFGLPLRILYSSRGSCSQRNRILRNVPTADILLFLDDDFLMSDGYLAEMENVFASRPDVAMCTGTVDADGVTGPGIAIEEALDILRHGNCRAAASSSRLEPVHNGYGCNMAVRMTAVARAGLFFDENLPLYGWLEDVDFSRRLAPFGGVVRSQRARGVHLGTKLGRTSGLRFGYSQVANPIYLVRKRTLSPRRAAAQLLRNLAANAVKVLRPEPWVDRRGRVRGNLRALADLLRGRLAPQNVMLLE